MTDAIDFAFPVWGMLITGILLGAILWPVHRKADWDMRWIPPWAVVIPGLVAGWIFTGIPFPPPP